MAMGVRYPFDFDFSDMNNGRLIKAALTERDHFDRADLSKLVEELALRLESLIEAT